MRTIQRTKQFRKDLQRAARRHAPLEELAAVLADLQADQPLAARHRDHELKGEFHRCRECHIRGDWLLVYRKEPGTLILYRLGTHSDLFE